jgi:3-oxoacyl-[acyl-carrier-protein] synthase II
MRLGLGAAMSAHRVAITGMGLVTGLGAGVAATWDRLVAGESAIAPISFFDASQYACRVAAEVRAAPDAGPEPAGMPPSYCRRGVRLFVQAAREAFEDARLARSESPRERMGVAAGTSVNYVNVSTVRRHFGFRASPAPQVDLERLAREAPPPPHTFYRGQGGLMAALCARDLGLGGPNVVSDTACAASAYAIGEAFRMVRRGQADAMLAGGGCALVNPITILAFAVLHALSTNPDPAQASRPFDRRRDGFVLGEGAGAVVLERLDQARARGAVIYGELVGFGASLNALNLTDPSPDGAAEEHAMRRALDEAGLAPEQIDYVAAHGTSTPKNDAVETLALKRLFGGHARRLLVSSNKGQLGHTISAAGVCNLIATLKAMQQRRVAPTANYREPDPRCDLDYVPNVARRAEVGAALVNAFAFGGQNAALAVRAVEARG